MYVLQPPTRLKRSKGATVAMAMAEEVSYPGFLSVGAACLFSRSRTPSFSVLPYAWRLRCQSDQISHAASACDAGAAIGAGAPSFDEHMVLKEVSSETEVLGRARFFPSFMMMARLLGGELVPSVDPFCGGVSGSSRAGARALEVQLFPRKNPHPRTTNASEAAHSSCTQARVASLS